MLKPPAYWIEHLKLKPHPEGGYYKETYRSAEIIESPGLPARFPGKRHFCTAIYFLLPAAERSLFHRIKSDEIWHFHTGCSLSIYVLTKSGLTIHRVGANPEAGETLQVVIPANCWFGAKVNDEDAYSLCSCTVSPGFDFEDFEMADRLLLSHEYPEYMDEIIMFTKP